jgi:hypothetical protein
MSDDNNLAILEQLEYEAFAREILWKSETGALVWSQAAPGQYFSAMDSTDGYDHWEYWIGRTKVNTSDQYINQYTLDVLLNGKPFLTVNSAVIGELFYNVESTLRQTQKKIHKAAKFVQALKPCEDNHVYIFERKIKPFGIASANAFGTLTIRSTVALQLTGIASDNAFGTPSTGRLIALTGIPSIAASGTLVVAQVFVPGIASVGAVGTPTVVPSSSMALTGLGSSETFGSHTVA